MITSVCQKLLRTFLSTNVCLGLALALVTFSDTPPTHAATFWWNTTTTGLWSSGGNWSSAASGGTSGMAPASSVSTDDVVFNQSAVNGNETIQLDAARSIKGMTFNNTGSTLLQASAPGTQTLTLGTGGITLGAGAGAVTIGNATNAVPLTMSGTQAWTNNSASLLTIVNNVTNGGNVLTVTGTGTGGTQIDGIIAGAGGLTKSGSGTLTLTGSNTFSGATTINSGTLSIAGAGMLANTTYASTVPAYSNTISNAGAFVYSSSASQALTGIISGTGSLTMAGSGMLTLTANNSYTGNTTISSGTLALGPINTASNSGGRLGGGTYAGAITNNGVLLLNMTANQTFSGVISGSGSIIKTGAYNNQSTYSALVLTGSSTFSGSVAIQSGTVQLNFAGTGAPASNILSPSSSVVMGVNVGTATPAVSAYGGSTVGGAAVLVRPQSTTNFTVTGSTGLSNSQSIAGLTVNDGIAQVAVTASAASSMTLNMGNLQRSTGSRGIVNFTPSTTGTATLFTTATNTNGIVGPWAFVTGSVINWATSAASSGSSGALTGLAVYDTTWSPGANTNVTSNTTVPAGSVTNSLRFGGAAATTVTLSGTNTITSGGILIGTAFAGNITGGVLRGSATDGLLIAGAGGNSNYATISSTIVDNGGPTGLTYAPFGNATTYGLRLSGNNTYTGKTLLMGSISLSSFETGSSGPLGAGGQVEFKSGGLVYDNALNSYDYSSRFTASPNQHFGASVNEYQTVTWASAFGGSTASLGVAAQGNLVLTGSNAFPIGMSITGQYIDNRTNRGNFGSLTLGSIDAVGTVGSVNVQVNPSYLASLRFTAASAALDLGSRLTTNSGLSAGIDTNGQNVEFATNVNLSGNSGIVLKMGAGQLTLSGSVNTAGLQVSGGTLSIDSRNLPAGLTSAPLTGYGIGTFGYSGASGTSRSGTMNGVTLQSGLLTIAVNNVGTSTTLNLSGAGNAVVGRATAVATYFPGFGGTVDFRAVSGTFGTTAIIRTGTAQPLTNGILGPWATVDGTDWATHTSGTILAYNAYTDVTTDAIADGAVTNARITTTTGTVTLGAATTTVNTLLQSAASAATLSLPSQTLLTGGVMVGRTAAALTIGNAPGSGTLQPATAGGEIILSNFGTGTMTVNSVIANNTSASRLTVSGNGTVVLTASNTLTGTTMVHGGTLQIGTGGTTGSLASPVIYVAPGGTLIFDRTDDYGGTFTAGIWGTPYGDNYAGGIIVRGGNLTLTPAVKPAYMTNATVNLNTYSGFTQLLGGTVTVGVANALSTAGDITFGGGVLRYGSGITTDFSGRIASSTSAIVVDTNGQSPTWNYPIAGSNTAGLEKRGTGTLTLNNVSSYLGTTTVTAGVLKASAQAIPGDVANSGTLAFSNDALGVNGVYAGVISGTGFVVNESTSAAVATLTGTSTFATVPVIQQGRLDFGWIAAAGQPSPLGTSGTVSLGVTSVTSGTLGYAGGTNLTFDRVVNLAGTTAGGGLAADGAGAFIVTSNLAISGVGTKAFTLTGSGTAANEMRGVIPNFDGTRLTNLTKTGDGLWRVTGTNTFTGRTSITGGTLVVDRLTNSGVNGPLGAPTTSAAIEIGSTTGLAALRYSGTGSTSTNRGITLTGTGTLEAAGSGGATFGAVGAGSGTNALVLTGTSRAANTVGAISNASGGVTNVFKEGAGSWTLSSVSGFTGRLTVKQGTILAAVGTGPSGDGVFGAAVSPSLLPMVGDSAAGASGFAAMLLEDGVVLNRSLQVAALGSGANQVAILGGANTSGTSTFAYNTEIRIGRGVSLQAATGGTVDFGNVWLDSTGTGSPAFSYAIGTAGNLGTVRLSNPLATTSGSVSINYGTLLFGANNQVASSTPVSIGSSGGNGTLNLDGNSLALSRLNFNGAGSFGGTVANSGTGTLTMQDGIAAALIQVNSGTAHAINSAIAMANATTVSVASSAQIAINGAISGAFGLNKSGSGALTLSGNSLFSGATTVSAGTLLVNGSLASTAGLNVDSGAFLGGSGSLASTIAGAGLVGPGNSPGILTALAVDPSAGTDFSFEMTGTGAPAWSVASASVNDVLHLTSASPFTSTLNSSNAVNIYFQVASLAAGDTFQGGFFTDATLAQSNLLTNVSAGSFNYFVQGNGSGSNVYNGFNYYTLAEYLGLVPSITGVTMSTQTVASANFGTGTVTNGQVVELVIVPEPGAIALAGIGAVVVGWTAMRHRRRSGRASA